MRIDHHAYQRATRVAGVGFLVQLGIGLVLLVFGMVGGETRPQDTAFLFGAVFVLIGLLAWLGLIVIFNQQKLERLEALEEDELAAGRESSVFTAGEEEVRVAARRLRLMHRWLVPTLSLIIAGGLVLSAWMMLRHMGRVAEGEAAFRLTAHTGWAVAICLAFSAMSFIVSRFVAGMAKQPAWHILRGGAAFMVGNSLVTLAIAVGIGFRFFRRDEVIQWIAYAIPIFMLVLTSEIVLNFILNLYRPRVADETPRPAFDSKLLSFFSAPDSLVRSINEAVNYQFGFDITSSWGYQLLLRSFLWLLGLGVVALVALNMVVIVEPNQQAVKLARGALVGDRVHPSGVMSKLPWPLQAAEVYDVTSLRTLHVTSKQVVEADVQLWTDDPGRKFDKPLEPFIVGSSTRETEDFADDRIRATPEAAAAGADEQASKLSRFSLVDAEIVLEYRIREDDGLLDYLRFSSDEFVRRAGLPRREMALRAIAQREIGQELARLSIDEILAARRTGLAEVLRSRVQAAFDADRTGVELVAVNVPLLRPAGEAAPGFEELSISHQAREQYIADAREVVVAGLAQLVGDPDRAEPVIAEIETWERLVDERGTDAEETLAQRAKIERMLVATGGEVAQIISRAERDRWVRLMQARARASRLRGQVVSYRAAPRLFTEREKMLVYRQTLPDVYKYVVCVDPSRVGFDLKLTELTSMFNFADALGEFTEESGASGQ